MVNGRNGVSVSIYASMAGSIYDQTSLAFRQRCTQKLEQLGDLAVNTQQLDDAITQYSAALSLDLTIPHVFIKRSRVYMAKRLWKEALGDATQVRHCQLVLV